MKILSKNALKCPHIQVAIAAMVIVMFRLVYLNLTALDLAPDEAHYWDWSRHLQLSYYSKPPMVAWLIHISTSIFGHTLIGVRFFSVIGLAILSLIGFSIVKKWRGIGAAWIAFLLLNVTPEFAVGGLLMTPDVPSLVFWALGLWMVTKIDWSSTSTSLKPFIMLGVILGLGGLSKYTVVLFFPLLFLFLVSQKELRIWLKMPHIYVAGLVALLMTIPVFYWNFMNDFVGFKHVMSQGGNSDPIWHKTLGNFLGGQLGVVGLVPFLMLLAVWMGGKLFTERTAKILWWFSAPLFLFFFIKALGGKVQPNWPVLSIYGGLLLLSGWVVLRAKWVKVVFGLGLVLNLMITIVAHDTFILRMGDKWFERLTGIHLSIKKDPLKPVFGWRGLGYGVDAIRSRIGDDTVILTTRYQTASELGFYMIGNPNVLYVNPGWRRQNQLDYWPWPGDLHKKAFIYVKEGGEIEPEIAQAFTQCMLMDKVLAHRRIGNVGYKLREANVYACGGYKGLERKMPERY